MAELLDDGQLLLDVLRRNASPFGAGGGFCKGHNRSTLVLLFRMDFANSFADFLQCSSSF